MVNGRLKDAVMGDMVLLPDWSQVVLIHGGGPASEMMNRMGKRLSLWTA